MFSWRLPCPHCNGPNEIALDRHCLTCKFCGAGLWVRCPEAFPTVAAAPRIDQREAAFQLDHYLKEQRRPLSQPGRHAEMVHFPFWHIRAIVGVHHPRTSDGSTRAKFISAESFEWGFTEVQTLSPPRHDDSGDAPWDIKPWDFSFPAFDQGLCGMDSLGVRTQTIVLGGCGDSTSEVSRWLLPSGQATDAVPRLSDSIKSLLARIDGPNPVAPRIIAPQVSLVYWPVWILANAHTGSISRVEIDAVSGRVIRETSELVELPGLADAVEGEPPRLLPHRCSSCGADLPVEGMLTVFPCSNCGVLVAHVENGDRRVLTCEFARDSSRQNSEWYPFWLFEPDDIMVPAFPIRNLRALLRFGTTVSGHRRIFSVSAEPEVPAAGVSLMPEVALGLAALIYEERAKSSKPYLSTRSKLVFIPLQKHNGELCDPVTGLCLSRAALALHE